MANDSKKTKRIQWDDISAFVYLVLVAGSIIWLIVSLVSNRVEPTATTQTDEFQSVDAGKIIITLDQAKEYVGKTLKKLCLEYRDAVNLRPNAGGINYGIESAPCDEVGLGYYFDDFIVVQAYYDDEYLSSGEYKWKKEECERTGSKYCDALKKVYVDSMQRDEAAAAGIQIK